MSRTRKLNELQLILLSTAAQRDDGNVLPFPDQLAEDADRVRKAIPPLLRAKLIQEVPDTVRALHWREEDDQLIGLALTDKGRAALGIAGGADAPADLPAPAAEKPGAGGPGASAPRAGTKAEQVLTLLRRNEGATLAELVAATGWLPHTTRAALTSLRKKGHNVEKSRRGEETCYRIGTAA